jgi:sugar/nucleoside kinase (ribokinase family)
MIVPNGPALRPEGPRRLVLAGEALVDVVLRVQALPPRGGDLLASSGDVTAGGGFNVMAAAARHGLPVLYAGGHGTGPWGDLIRAALAAEGIALLRPADTGGDTGFDVALVEPDGERTFVTRLGAEMVRGPGGWDAVPAGPGDAVYVSGYGLAAAETGPALSVWAAALPPGVLLFMDPGPLVAQIPAAVFAPVLARCDWLSCNEREAALLDGAGPAARSPAETAQSLLARSGRAGVIVRAGAAGCYVARPGAGPAAPGSAGPGSAGPGSAGPGSAGPGSAGTVHVPAPAVTAVDTTGAGDAHSGVFLAALAEGLAPLAAAARANAAAAFAVTRPGPATAPTRGELDAWLAGRPVRLSGTSGGRLSPSGPGGTHQGRRRPATAAGASRRSGTSSRRRTGKTGP